MKEKGSRKVNFPEAIILLVIVVFIMIWTTLIGQIPTAVGLVYCAALCGIYGKILGHTWDEMFKNILHVVHGALPAIFLLLLVGFISASWIGSGTIPYMIYLGLELMHPTIYLFSAFFYCNGFKLGDCLVTWYCTDRHCLRPWCSASDCGRRHRIRMFSRRQMVSIIRYAKSGRGNKPA